MPWFSCSEPLVSGVNSLQLWASCLARRRTGTRGRASRWEGRRGHGNVRGVFGKSEETSLAGGELERQVEARRRP